MFWFLCHHAIRPEHALKLRVCALGFGFVRKCVARCVWNGEICLAAVLSENHAENSDLVKQRRGRRGRAGVILVGFGEVFTRGSELRLSCRNHQPNPAHKLAGVNWVS